MKRFVPFTWIITVGVITATPAFAQSAASVERGMKVFADQRCSLCHSIAGKGNPKGQLDDVGSKLAAVEIRQWLVAPEEMRQKTHAERKPAMKVFVSLPKDDLDGRVAYIQTLRKN